VEQDAKCASHVVVASPCDTQSAWRAGYELVARAAGKDAQRFKRAGHIGSGQAVEAMFPFGQHFNQSRCP